MDLKGNTELLNPLVAEWRWVIHFEPLLPTYSNHHRISNVIVQIQSIRRLDSPIEKVGTRNRPKDLCLFLNIPDVTLAQGKAKVNHHCLPYEFKYEPYRYSESFLWPESPGHCQAEISNPPRGPSRKKLCWSYLSYYRVPNTVTLKHLCQWMIRPQGSLQILRASTKGHLQAHHW